ncbi:MAG: hypothetical protein GTO24_24735, partial [candidate division Zixibacteria bacterium]|nr:hypothetical protein [candidate division Zixibacteria bacterium]
MRIVCESCKTCFRLDDSKISDNVVKVRCSKCKHVFTVRRAKITSDSLKRLVAPGRYVVSRTGNQKLEAHLGTSVGVSLRDRTAGVGGLIHLLLPDPTGIDKPRQPEKYAETGLLLFIQAMCDLGARKQRLEACVAGGALLGSFSRKGSNLDIGGQTTEVVERILHREGIPVYESETGGCLGCCLSLDLQTWKTEIRPIGTDTAPAVTVFKKPTAEQLEQSIQQARPIPQIALKALRMIRDQKHSLEDVAQEIRQDQVISARV